jgi:hypothetical protein
MSPFFLYRNGHFAGKKVTACGRGGQMGDREAHFSIWTREEKVMAIIPSARFQAVGLMRFAEACGAMGSVRVSQSL